jgi:hypothetical protein
MSNSLLTISMITKEALRILRNNLAFAKGVNRQYDDSFANAGAKIGSVINIRKPVRFNVTNGASLQLQDVQDQSVALTLNQQKHVGFQFSSKDMTLSIDDFSSRYIAPAINALGNQIDLDGLALATSVANSVGTPGTTPATSLVYLQALQKLDENATPMDGLRNLAINPAAQAATVDALKGLFQSGDQIASQYEKGRMAVGLGFNWMMDQNIQTNTIGALGGTPVVNGASQSGASLITNGWTASVTGALKAGNVFTIAGVYAVNPVSFQSTGSLKQFVVTADASSDGSGNITLAISPSIVGPGSPYQNVSVLPANAAALAVVGAANIVTPQNLAYHRDAFVLGMADLELPRGVEMAAKASDPESGLSLRIVRAYDIVNDQHPCRIDVLYGWQAMYPELACRIQG